MRIISSSLVLFLVLVAGACSRGSSSPGSSEPGITAARLTEVRHGLRYGMPAVTALAEAQRVLGPPTVVDGPQNRWLLVTPDHCTELRIVGDAAKVGGVALFTVTPTAGAQYKDCMAASGNPIAEEPSPPRCAPKT